MSVRPPQSLYPPPPGRRGYRGVAVGVIAITVIGLVLLGLTETGILPSTGGYRILFVGASVTEGYYASSPQSAYPADTVRQLEDRGLDVSPVIEGHAGSGTAAVLKWRLQGSPDAMVLQIATNDFGKLTLARYQANYVRILTVLRALGPTARLLCLGAWRNPDETNNKGQSGAQFNQITQAACQRFGGRFVNLGPIFLVKANHGPQGRETSYGRADWFHPNNKGHAAIAAAVVKALEPLPQS